MFERDNIDVPVIVAVDGRDVSYLGKWASHPKVRIELPSEARAARLKGRSVGTRINDTFLRCLEVADENEELVVCQDDVKFARGWLSFTRRASVLAAKRAALRWQGRRRPFIIALYSPTPKKGKPLANYRPRGFYGNQGTYFSADVVAPLRDYLLRGKRTLMDDMVINRFATGMKAALFALNPSAVQHVGSVSTHTGSAPPGPMFNENGFMGKWPHR